MTHFGGEIEEDLWYSIEPALPEDQAALFDELNKRAVNRGLEIGWFVQIHHAEARWFLRTRICGLVIKIFAFSTQRCMEKFGERLAVYEANPMPVLTGEQASRFEALRARAEARLLNLDWRPGGGVQGQPITWKLSTRGGLTINCADPTIDGCLNKMDERLAICEQTPVPLERAAA